MHENEKNEQNDVFQVLSQSNHDSIHQPQYNNTFQYYKDNNYFRRLYKQRKYFFTISKDWRENRDYFNNVNSSPEDSCSTSSPYKSSSSSTTYYDDLIKDDIEYKTFVDNQMKKRRESKNSLSRISLYEYLVKKGFIDHTKQSQAGEEEEEEQEQEEQQQEEEEQQQQEEQQEEEEQQQEEEQQEEEEQQQEEQQQEEQQQQEKNKTIIKIGQKIRVLLSKDEGYILRCHKNRINKSYIVVVNNKLYSYSENEIEVLYNVPPLMYEEAKKYFLFFSYPDTFRNAIFLDTVSLYSTTDCQTADLMTQTIIQEFSLKFRSTILDATACIGGNTLSFYKHFRTVIAIEENEDRFKLLQNNAKVMERYLKATKYSSNQLIQNNKYSKKACLDNKKKDKYKYVYYKNHSNHNKHDVDITASFYYPINKKHEWRHNSTISLKENTESEDIYSGVFIENKIYLYNESCLTFLENLECPVDVIFFDPPWGGADYKFASELNVYLDDIPIANICNTYRDKCNIGMVIKVPLNFHLKDFLTTIEPFFVCDDCRKYYNVILILLKKKNKQTK